MVSHATPLIDVLSIVQQSLLWLEKGGVSLCGRSVASYNLHSILKLLADIWLCLYMKSASLKATQLPYSVQLVMSFGLAAGGGDLGSKGPPLLSQGSPTNAHQNFTQTKSSWHTIDEQVILSKSSLQWLLIIGWWWSLTRWGQRRTTTNNEVKSFPITCIIKVTQMWCIQCAQVIRRGQAWVIIKFDGFCLWLQVGRLEISITCSDMLSETRFTLKSFMATLSRAIKSGWWMVYSLLRGHTICKRGLNDQKTRSWKSPIGLFRQVWLELFKLHHIHASYTCIIHVLFPLNHIPLHIVPPK